MARARADSEAVGEEDTYEFPTGVKKNPPHLDGVPDMASLIYLEEPNIVWNIRCRYLKADIYTYVSSILVAVNPYEELPLYSQKVMEQYKGRKRNQLMQLPPHCFAVGEDAYQQLAKTGVNQSMVICGESGSGKTETAKVFMRYLSHVTHTTEKKADGLMSIEDQFLEANPILEAFGNAQTIMNNNSSRFGKFTKVLFATPKTTEERPRIIGSFIETYLLEKSRVVKQGKGERNYHIFYQLCQGLSEAKRKEWQVTDMTKFHYISQSGHYSIPGVNDGDNFLRVQEAFTALLITPEEQDNIFRIVAGLLHVGNITFDNADAEAVKVHPSSDNSLGIAAKLFDVDLEGLRKRFTSRTIKVGAQVINKPLKSDEAVYNRDSVVKAIYQALFAWIVARVNKELFLSEARGDKIKWIGILDVFGFESSDFDNSFEQFCINFANERLQQYFNEHVIMSEQEEYVREALPWKPLEVDDNQDTIDLVDSKPNGIVAILDSTCVMPKGSDEIFLTNLMQANKDHPRIKQARARPQPKNKANAPPPKDDKRGVREKFNGFTIEHYAGHVTYNVDGFLDKNNDSSDAETVTLFCGSKAGVTKELLAADAAADRRRAFKSVGASFSQQLSSLMTMLRSTTPHFVRCVNPNQFKQPQMFDPEYLLPQLRCGGLMEALRVLKLGFPSRVPYQEIFERYGHVLPIKVNPKDFSEALFVGFGLAEKEYQLGLTKVFFRPGKQEFLEEVLKNPVLKPEMVAKIRSLLVRKRIRRIRAAILLLVRLDMWVQQFKARRRFKRLGGLVFSLARAFYVPLLQVKEERAAKVLQAAIRTTLATKGRTGRLRGAVVVQHAFRHALRRRALTAKLTTLVAQRKERRLAATAKLQAFSRRQHRRRALGKELAARVEATRVRKAKEAALAKEAKEAAERERQRLLAEERARAEKEAAEARKKAEEERKVAEAAAAAAAAEKKKQEEAQRAREEAEKKEREARIREEEDRLRREQDEERKRREEEARQEEERAKAIANRRKRRGSVSDRWAIEQLETTEAEAEAKRKEEEELLQRRLAEEEEQKRRQKEEEERYKAKLELQARTKADLEAKRAERAAAQATAPAGAAGRPAPPPTPPPTHILLKYHKFTPEEEAEHMRQMLLEGGKFLKYGKMGKAHIKHVCMNVTGQLHWDDKAMDSKLAMPSESFLKLSEVKEVLPGKQTANLKRKAAERAPDHLCFSVVTKDRTLDLQAVAGEQRDMWVRALEMVVKDIKDKNLRNMVTGDDTDPMQTVAEHEQKLKAEAEEKALADARASGNFAVLLDKMAAVAQEKAPAAGEAASAISTLTGDQLLAAGEKIVKHGRQGKPKGRWINCSQTKFCWGNFKQPSLASGASFVNLADISDIKVGRTTEVFSRRTAVESPDDCCFSLISKGRSIDIQCDTKDRRDAWVEALKMAVARAKKAAHASWIAQKRQESVTGRRSITGRAAADAVDPDTEVGARVRNASIIANATANGGTAAPSQLPVMEVEPPAEGDLPKVIASMARRGSVELMAQNMARNMERQAKLQGPNVEEEFGPSSGRVRGASSAGRPPMSSAVPEHLREKYERRRSQLMAHAADPDVPVDRTTTQMATQAAAQQGGVEQKNAAEMKLAETGAKFLKFGRMGKPKDKYVQVFQHKLFWGETANPAQNADSSFVQLAEVQKIQKGKQTDVFQRGNAKAFADDECFSLILKNRTLDLKADTRELRDQWVDAMKVVVYQAKKAAHNLWLARKRGQTSSFRGRADSMNEGDAEISEDLLNAAPDARDATNGSIMIKPKQARPGIAGLAAGQGDDDDDD